MTIRGAKNSTMIRNIFMISMLSLLMGQFYINSSDTGLRLTLIVIFMALFLLYYKSYNAFLVTFCVGLATLLSRSFINYVTDGDITFISSFLYFLPVMTYYILYGVLFQILNIRAFIKQPINTFLSLLVCDTIPNVIEASVRGVWRLAEFEDILSAIIFVGLIRTFITVSVYYGADYYIRHFQKSEREKYYKELIIFISKLKTELFLLKKSSQDIEEMVSRVHDLYEKAQDEDQKAALMTIAKDVHEIKKDYLRVMVGMSGVVDDDTVIQYLSIKDILRLVSDNGEKIVQDKGKKIVIHTSFDNLFVTHEFYALVSLLNNLLINSIDALEITGRIDINVAFDNKDIMIEVKDNGEGIVEAKQKLIFEPGYTTKYDKVTGKTSTGLGLSHVWNIVVKQLLGTVELQSKKGIGTSFLITIPKETLIKEKEF